MELENCLMFIITFNLSEMLKVKTKYPMEINYIPNIFGQGDSNFGRNLTT